MSTNPAYVPLLDSDPEGHEQEYETGQEKSEVDSVSSEQHHQ